MSIYDTLRRDHQALEQLLEDLGEAVHEEDRTSLLEELRVEVLILASAKRAVLHNAMLARGNAGADLIERQRRRHNELEHTVEELINAPMSGPAFTRGLAALGEQLRAHVATEANELLPLARQILGDDQDDRLGKQFREEKQRLQDRGFEPVC